MMELYVSSLAGLYQWQLETIDEIVGMRKSMAVHQYATGQDLEVQAQLFKLSQIKGTIVEDSDTPQTEAEGDEDSAIAATSTKLIDNNINAAFTGTQEQTGEDIREFQIALVFKSVPPKNSTYIPTSLSEAMTNLRFQPYDYQVSAMAHLLLSLHGEIYDKRLPTRWKTAKSCT
jgi:hypothetical protein